jgi:hypothetical protein
MPWTAHLAPTRQPTHRCIACGDLYLCDLAQFVEACWSCGGVVTQILEGYRC